MTIRTANLCALFVFFLSFSAWGEEASFSTEMCTVKVKGISMNADRYIKYRSVEVQCPVAEKLEQEGKYCEAIEAIDLWKWGGGRASRATRDFICTCRDIVEEKSWHRYPVKQRCVTLEYALSKMQKIIPLCVEEQSRRFKDSYNQIEQKTEGDLPGLSSFRVWGYLKHPDDYSSAPNLPKGPAGQLLTDFVELQRSTKDFSKKVKLFCIWVAPDCKIARSYYRKDCSLLKYSSEATADVGALELKVLDCAFRDATAQVEALNITIEEYNSCLARLNEAGLSLNQEKYEQAKQQAGQKIEQAKQRDQQQLESRQAVAEQARQKARQKAEQAAEQARQKAEQAKQREQQQREAKRAVEAAERVPEVVRNLRERHLCCTYSGDYNGSQFYTSTGYVCKPGTLAVSFTLPEDRNYNKTMRSVDEWHYNWLRVKDWDRVLARSPLGLGYTMGWEKFASKDQEALYNQIAQDSTVVQELTSLNKEVESKLQLVEIARSVTQDNFDSKQKKLEDFEKSYGKSKETEAVREALFIIAEGKFRNSICNSYSWIEHFREIVEEEMKIRSQTGICNVERLYNAQKSLNRYQDELPKDLDKYKKLTGKKFNRSLCGK